MGEEEKEEIIEDEEEEGGAKEDAGGRRFETSKIVKILLYGAGALVLILLMGGIAVLVFEQMKKRDNDRRADIVAAPPPEALATFELKDFTMTTSDAEPHFIKMKISLAYETNPELNNELVSRRDQIENIVNLILASKKYEDLDETSDKLALAEEIKAHVNQILIVGKIRELYYKDLMLN